MSTLTHGEFIEKMAAYKPLYEWQKQFGKSWKDVAAEFNLSMPVLAASRFRFYERHAREPQVPALANITHYLALSVANAIGFTTIESLRADLIRRFSASIGVSRAYPTGLSRRALRILLNASGLEWFEKGIDRRMYVHWKHDKGLAA